MSGTHLLARAYISSSDGSSSNKHPLIIGLVCGVLAIGIGMIALVGRANRRKRHDPEALITRAQRLRRENNGWWGAAPVPKETAAERRRRNLEMRAPMGGGGGQVREAGTHEIITTMGGGSGTRGVRRERGTRDAEAAPPMYQLPAPAYYANPEWRRQHLAGRRHLALSPLTQESDAPPAYESPAVWPIGVRVP